MNILLTNDDGIYAPGLWALYKAFSGGHDVTVIAPDRECSAIGYGITLHSPLRLDKININGEFSGYAVSGTPVDCIKMGILEILEDHPDLVISGINPGANVGININYSGTVSAAREAALYGIPAIAVSVQGTADSNYNETAQFVAALAENIRERGLPLGTMLNVNIPGIPFNRITGVRISRQGMDLFPEQIEKRIDPRQRVYYWQGGEPEMEFEHPDVDGAALKARYITVTPIKCDMTDYRMMEELKGWGLDKP